MAYYYPFGEQLHPLTQQDRTKKQVFVLGVYASAVHARWKKDGKVVCRALAVASEPRIFWDGDQAEAERIISRIYIPPELGKLEPADRNLNGPSAKVLDEQILAPLGFTRNDAWLCDCLPETRLNPGQRSAIQRCYEPQRGRYGLNPVTVPAVPKIFCDAERAAEITDELMESGAGLLVLLGDIPIRQYLKRVAEVPFSSLKEYCDLYGYGTRTEVEIGGRYGKAVKLEVLPLTHPSRSKGWAGTVKSGSRTIWNGPGTVPRSAFEAVVQASSTDLPK